jgi:hypothetical protein
MKGLQMDINWRTVQVFLETAGVFEVEVDQTNNKKARCTCPAFGNSARCKHVKFVKQQMEQNDGHYSVSIPVDIPDEEAIKAMATAEDFREFILKYGKVEVIE